MRRFTLCWNFMPCGYLHGRSMTRCQEKHSDQDSGHGVMSRFSPSMSRRKSSAFWARHSAPSHRTCISHSQRGHEACVQGRSSCCFCPLGILRSRRLCILDPRKGKVDDLKTQKGFYVSNRNQWAKKDKETKYLQIGLIKNKVSSYFWHILPFHEATMVLVFSPRLKRASGNLVDVSMHGKG